jgi:DNA-binding NarL/FixJ family response regulator
VEQQPSSVRRSLAAGARGFLWKGASSDDLADQLFLSVNSVKTYVRQIYQKVGVARRAQAVAWGLAHGF